MIFVWLAANSNWLIPSTLFVISEYRGIKSGGEKASVSQVIIDLFKFASTQAGEKNDSTNPGGPNDKLD